MLKQIQVQLYSLVSSKDSTPFLSILMLNLGKCCQLCLPVDIKVQTSKKYKKCKHRYKLYYINQTGQSTKPKETCIKFEKYGDCRFWANIYKIYWDFCSIRMISLYEKKNQYYTKSVIVLICFVLINI